MYLVLQSIELMLVFRDLSGYLFQSVILQLFVYRHQQFVTHKITLQIQLSDGAVHPQTPQDVLGSLVIYVILAQVQEV